MALPTYDVAPGATLKRTAPLMALPQLLAKLITDPGGPWPNNVAAAARLIANPGGPWLNNAAAAANKCGQRLFGTGGTTTEAGCAAPQWLVAALLAQLGGGSGI